MLLKIAVGVTESGTLIHPVSGLVLGVTGADGNRNEIRSDDAGIAPVFLFAGIYRVVSLEPVIWQGKPYSWDLRIQVVPGMGTLRLTQENSTAAVALAIPSPRAEPKPVVPELAVPTSPVPQRPTAPQPLTPQPVTPQPVTPQPVTPQPATPQPVAPQAPASQPPSTSASARAPGSVVRIRKGFWLNASLGYGRLGCYLCNGYFNGLGGGLSFGKAVNQRLLLGVGTSAWTKSEGGVTRSLGMVDARLRFYSNGKGTLFVTGGLGVGIIGSDVSGIGSRSTTGVGFLVGIGRDFQVANNVSLTPFGNAFAIRTADSDATVGQIGLGLTFH
ncbi:MAG: hypothetical protein ABI875_07115 [Gemmatimonadales bacterium]